MKLLIGSAYHANPNLTASNARKIRKSAQNVIKMINSTAFLILMKTTKNAFHKVRAVSIQVNLAKSMFTLFTLTINFMVMNAPQKQSAN